MNICLPGALRHLKRCLLLGFVWGLWALSPNSQAQTATQDDFKQWLTQLRREARDRGVSQQTLEAALTDLTPLQRVIKQDRSQPESQLSLDTYLQQRVTPERIRQGRQLLQKHRQLLQRIENRYKVPAPILVAIWGLESNYGRYKGTYNAIQALATLAFDPRRGTYFRRELLAALEIWDQNPGVPLPLKGSWAGALGQCQFMPSSYQSYAQDFDQDGQRDIWNSTADTLASIAYYLKANGWKAGVSPGIQRLSSQKSRLPAWQQLPGQQTSGCRALQTLSTWKPLQFWQGTGVALPPKTSQHKRLALVNPQPKGSQQAFLVGTNYDVLLKYNCAHAYALSVAQLAQVLENKATPEPDSY